MRPHDKIITAAAIAFALLVSYLGLSVSAAGGRNRPRSRAAAAAPPAASPSPTPTVFVEDAIEQRDDDQRGIIVGQPRVYDDALLQQMLQAAESRLATLQVLDQSQILSRLGAVTGASQQVSSFGLNVQGAPVPGVTTATSLPTQTTTQTTAAGASNSSLSVVSGLGTENVTTTQPQFGPPGATAPAPATTLPSSGFSVSSSDILNEQLQLTAEINALRLMLAGDLSSHFVRNGDNSMTKLKTTLGFPITLVPDERFKDAVAVVEVEVTSAGQTLSNEPPSITTLLPREKTYNVAEITDKSSSISGGVATQLIGVSGSFMRARRTYYLVQDQDTLALELPTPRGSTDKTNFMWEFRPVLGRRYVKGGLKQTFVQLAFPVPGDAVEGQIGKVRVRTYWRRYDRKHRIREEIVPNSTSLRDVYFDIPRYSLAIAPPRFNPLDSLEDIGDGKLLVKLRGRFLPGTYVRIGTKLLTGTPQLTHEHVMIRFVASASDLASGNAFLVSHDGTEVPLSFDDAICHRPQKISGVTSTASLFILNDRGDGSPYDIQAEYLPAQDKPHPTTLKVSGPRVTTIDEKNSLLSLNFVVVEEKIYAAADKRPESRAERVFAARRKEDIPGLVLIVGSRVFGYSDAPVDVEDGKLSAVVPSALLASNPEIKLQLLMPVKECRAAARLSAFDSPSQAERMVVLEQGTDPVKFLLYGTRLNGLMVLDPEGVRPEGIGSPGDPDRLLLIKLTPAQIQSHKQLLVQRPGDGERPFLITLPELAPKQPDPPKAKETITTSSDEAVIVGDGLKDVEGITLSSTGQDVAFKVAGDGKSMRLTGLKALNPNASAMTHTFLLKFKDQPKPKEVEVRVVDRKVENSSLN